MDLKLTEITQGWINAALKKFDLLSEEIQIMGEQRSKICANCSWCKKGEDIENKSLLMIASPKEYYCDHNESTIIEDKTITGCSCPISKKSISPKAKCPQEKWK